MTAAAGLHYAERMRQLLGVPVARLGVAGAQHGCQQLTATLADGRAVFAKAASGFGAGIARLHAAGADALRDPAHRRPV